MTSIISERNRRRHKYQNKSTKDVFNAELQNLLAHGINSRDAAILQRQDWKRIQDNLSKRNQEAEKYELRKKDRDELFKTSKEQVKHWDNTIEGQRLKKLQARKIRDDLEEKERLKLDVEEAKLQAKERKEAIERAKQLQYIETDRVKRFHGAFLLTEVLKERDAQIEMNAAKLRLEKEREDLLVSQQRKNYEDAMYEERDKAKAKFDLAFDNAEFQLMQVKDKERCLLKQKQEDVEEGQNMKEQYEIFLTATEIITKRNREYKNVMMNAYRDDIALKEERLHQIKIKETLADKQISKFVTAKRKMAEMRKAKEHGIFIAFQNHTEKIKQQLQREMQQKVDNEDERIKKAVTERERKRQIEEDRKIKVERESLEATYKHRIHMINEQEDRHKEELLKDKACLNQRIKNDENFEKSMIAEKVQKRSKAIEIQKFYVKQISNKKNKKRIMKSEQLKMDAKNMQLLVEEEKLFQDYSSEVIENAKHNHRNTFPLSQAKFEGPGGGRGPKFEGHSGLRPSYIVGDSTGVQLPHYVKDASIYNRVYGHVGKTQFRLGFTW